MSNPKKKDLALQVHEIVSREAYVGDRIHYLISALSAVGADSKSKKSYDSGDFHLIAAFASELIDRCKELTGLYE